MPKNTGVSSLSRLQGNLPGPGNESESLALQADFLPAELSRKHALCLSSIGTKLQLLLVKVQIFRYETVGLNPRGPDNTKGQ